MPKLSKDEILKLFEDTVVNQIVGGEEGLNRKINELYKKHKGKPHFIPMKYRILGGFLQSLNIKFGNFLEELFIRLISLEGVSYNIVMAGIKNSELFLEKECERLIDDYINIPPKSIELDTKFDELLDNIFQLQNRKDGTFRGRVLDVDLLLSNDKYYYFEVKYNDDHDTGKFKDINRKFLKTFAGLVYKLKVKDKDKFMPILYYFSESIRYSNVYLREGKNVWRGRTLFKELNLPVTWEEIDELLLKIGEELEDNFDYFRKKIFEKVKEKEKQTSLKN